MSLIMKAPSLIGPLHMTDDSMLQATVETVTAQISRQVKDSRAIEEPLEIQLTYEPDGSVLQWCYNGRTNYSGLTIYCNSHLGSAATGTWVDSTDEAGNHWQRTSDAFGRLTEVMEPSGVAQTASMETDYGYDVLNDLTSVTQWGGPRCSSGVRARSFSYDSLSRLLSAMNPETGTISYSYDANGNMFTKTDARSITTTSTYDALNRLTQKSYSDGTSTVLYGYDGSSISFVPPTGTRTTVALTNTIGRQSFASVEGGSSLYAFSYDAMGRVNNQWESTPSFSTTAAVYPVSVTYDLAGDRTSLTNSTGRTFNYTYDATGRLQTASNTVSLNGTPVTTPMVSSMTYFPSGQPQTTTTDTGSATVTGTWGIDSRLRVTSYQNLSTADSGDTNYGYSLTYTPNSNVKTDAETVYNPASGARSWSWNFGYDTLNRLTSAQSTGAISFGCGWTYDGFGNRLTQEPSGTGLSCTSLSSPVNANNHLSNPIYNHDAAGDILTEGGNTLTYDAEGRIKTGSGAFGVTTYNYGGDGQRVSKMLAGFDETDYIRDPDGSLLTTYVAGSYFGEFQDMWVGGKHFGEVSVASGNASQTQNFALNNWLGSLVAYASPSSGIPNTAYVSQPFGDAQTTFFGSNNNDIRFTGKERDAESGLDYFGARYYGSTMGRFMSPDDDSGEHADAPQSWNLYSYVQNNPITNTDPDGHDCVVQSRIDDNHESISVSSGNCAGKGTGSGQSATYVPGTVTGVSVNGGNSIDIGYNSYDGQSSGVTNSGGAPAFDHPGIDGPANAAIFGQIGNNGMGAIKWFGEQMAWNVVGGVAAHGIGLGVEALQAARAARAAEALAVAERVTQHAFVKHAASLAISLAMSSRAWFKKRWQTHPKSGRSPMEERHIGATASRWS
jgi:RHS repeat-associated protein